MTGLDHIGIAGLDVRLCAVVVHDVHRPGLHDAHMASLATLGPYDWLDALRPSPAWLERKAANGRIADSDQVDPCFRGSPRLVR